MNKGTLVLLHGLVRGMGQEVDVEVLTRRVQDHNEGSSLPAYKYVDCTVIGGPANLPDGDYIVSFAGFSAITTRRYGLWLSSGVAVLDLDEEQSFQSQRRDRSREASARSMVEEEPEAEPPTLKLSPQCDGHRSYLV